MRALVVAVVIAVSSSSAFALGQSDHESISYDSCVAAGLGDDFCERVGTEAYNVDAYEWSRPEAHAQIADSGQNSSACNAANATLERERQLGSDIRYNLGLIARAPGPAEDAATRVATSLGRALHTIQDDCAHKGMPNIQHAWASRSDTCNGTSISPDVAPGAAACARAETDAVFAAFRQSMSAAGVAPDRLEGVDSGWTHWPARGDVCAFLKSADSWDGTDGRWESSLVVPWLRDQLTRALTVDDSSIGDACTVGDAALRSYRPDPTVTVTGTLPWCLKLKTYCLGKADAPDEPPPWDASGVTPPAAGCAASRDTEAPGLLVVLGALGFTVRRRRQRERSARNHREPFRARRI